MKNEPEYHVGNGLCGIYAGRLNKKGNMWLSKSDVTDEAIKAVAQYLVENDSILKFDYWGKHYILKAEKKDD